VCRQLLRNFGGLTFPLDVAALTFVRGGPWPRWIGTALLARIDSADSSLDQRPAQIAMQPGIVIPLPPGSPSRFECGPAIPAPAAGAPSEMVTRTTSPPKDPLAITRPAPAGADLPAVPDPALPMAIPPAHRA